MATGWAIAILLLIGLVTANLPWFSDRTWFVWQPRRGYKPVWQRLIETVFLYGVFLLFGFGLERMVDGGLHQQSWVFFVVVICLFAVFATPGIIWQKDLRPLVGRAGRRT